MSKKSILSLAFLALAFSCLIEVGAAQTKRKIVPKRILTVVQVAPSAPVAESAPKNLSPELQKRYDSFLVVWRTIRDVYFDQTFNGLDWNKIKAEYEPRVLATMTDAQLNYILQEMINRLNRSHFAIVPPEVGSEVARAKAAAKAAEKKLARENEKANADAKDDAAADDAADEEDDFDAKFGIGVELRILNGQVVISQIEKDSAAEKAGLKTGFVVEKINEVSLKDFIERINKYGGAYARGAQKQLPLGIVAWFIDGEKDTSVELSYLDENDQPKQMSVKRERLKGESVKIMQNLPAQFASFEAESLSDDVGYIKFNLFVASASDKFCSAITEFKNKKAIVIDLRGNLGGSYGVLMGIAGLLTDRDFTIGTEIYKIGKSRRVIEPHLKNFKGRLVVLTDNSSYSAAEIFAAALQENGRAFVVGERSAGEALPAVAQTLPTGAIFLYPVANFETPKGNYIEGKGVEPDLTVPLDRKSLLAGGDKQLQAALDYLKNPSPKSNEQTIAARENNPPPAPKPKQPLKILGTVNVRAKIEPPKPVPVQQDAAALNVIDRYVAAIGGEKALRAVSSYAASGTVQIKEAGATVDGTIQIFRRAPDKFAEIVGIGAIGEVREFFDGEKYFIQSSIEGAHQLKEKDIVGERKLFADFYELLHVKETYARISFLGNFDRDGKRVDLVECETANGEKVEFLFDAATHFLARRTDDLFDIGYDDYRKTGDVFFPFEQTRGVERITLTDLKPNAAIDDKNFALAESCFDKVD